MPGLGPGIQAFSDNYAGLMFALTRNRFIGSYAAFNSRNRA